MKKKRHPKKKELSKKELFIKSWHEHRMYYIICIVVILVIMSIFTVFFSTSKLDFLMKEELLIEIDPLQDSIDVVYDLPVELEFAVKNNNFWFCRAECTFKLHDPYTGEDIAEETEIISTDGTIKKKYSIDLDTRGTGQRLFYFEADCHNIRSFFCKTQEPVASRSSFIAVNYGLSEDEKGLKQELGMILNNYTVLVSDARLYLAELSSMIEDVYVVKSHEPLSSAYTNRIDAQTAMLIAAEERWLEEDYYGVDSLFVEENAEHLERIEKELVEKLIQYGSLMTDYNKLVLDSRKLLVNISLLDDMFSFYLQTSQEDKAHEIRLLSKELSAILLRIKQDPIEKTPDHARVFGAVSDSFIKKVADYEGDKQRIIDDSYVLIRKHRAIQNRLYSKLGSATILVPLGGCERIDPVIEEYKQINSDAQDLLSTNYSFYVGDPVFESILAAYTESVLDANFSGTVNNTLNITASEFYRLVQLDDYSDLEDFKDSYCEATAETLPALPVTLLSQIMLSEFTAPEQLSVSFGDVPSKCCIFDDCFDCSVDSDRYPVIFLHGHSFNIENPIEASLGTFYKMQKKLADEENFINSGDIDSATSASGDVWSLMSYPVSVRASYYYLFYYDFDIRSASIRQTETVENYAIRLKELVDTVKTKTGASKVNIVAHSMGGLVARQYLVLFGEDSVDKLVLIGTPNHGVIGKVKSLCANLGAEKECDDMAADSIFMKRLNRPENIPQQVEVYTIYGTGCNTEGEDGDGLITAESVKLDFAENHEIKGVCTDFLGVEMHGDLATKPDKYPEVLETVVEILKD